MNIHTPGFLTLLLILPLGISADEPPRATVGETVDGGAVAYANGAFTPDGAYFVYARKPAAIGAGSELMALELVSGQVRALGVLPLRRAVDKDGPAPDFTWSLGVLGAEDGLATVFLAQYGPDETLAAGDAFAWDVKAGAVRPGRVAIPLAASPAKPDCTAVLEELDAEAAAARKKYLDPEVLLGKVGKKQLTVAPAKPIDATEAFRGLYAKAVAEFPIQRMGMDSGQLLASEEVSVLGGSGPWVLVSAELYVHYGIRGCGYRRVLAVDRDRGLLVTYERIGERWASGVRSGPEYEAWILAPGGKSLAGIAAGQLTIYRLPK